MDILYLEPFYSGSHKQFTDALVENTTAQWTPLTLPGRHWKWRARGAGVFFAQECSEMIGRTYDGLWASSFMPLQDFVALAPDYAATPRVLYFHENQLTYPDRFKQERDFHFAFTNFLSAL